MTALNASGLGKRYRQRWALSDCTLQIPEGRVAGLVGPNGAGKTTLLHLAVGLLAPTAGTITVLGGEPASGPGQLAKVGFVAQDTPVYAGLSVADHLRLGAHLNPAWDAAYAERRIGRIGLDPAQRAGKLSGGQRAQLALTLAIAKRPRLLILDEPVASLDPLARREFLDRIRRATRRSRYLGHLQPGHHVLWLDGAGHHPAGVPVSAGLQCVCHRARSEEPQAGGRLPARQPVLELPVAGDRHLPDRGHPAGLGLLLVGPPPPVLRSPSQRSASHAGPVVVPGQVRMCSRPADLRAISQVVPFRNTRGTGDGRFWALG